MPTVDAFKICAVVLSASLITSKPGDLCLLRETDFHPKHFLIFNSVAHNGAKGYRALALRGGEEESAAKMTKAEFYQIVDDLEKKYLDGVRTGLKALVLHCTFIFNYSGANRSPMSSMTQDGNDDSGSAELRIVSEDSSFKVEQVSYLPTQCL
jgi:hypothetical protein